MAKNILQGSDILISIGASETDKTPVAYATSHSISLSREVRDITSKESGIWGDSIAGNISWTASIEALYATDQEGYSEMFDALIAGTEVFVVSGQKASNAIGTTYYKGKAIITSLELTAGTTENLTYSVSLQGTGVLTRVGA